MFKNIYIVKRHGVLFYNKTNKNILISIKTTRKYFQKQNLYIYPYTNYYYKCYFPFFNFNKNNYFQLIFTLYFLKNIIKRK